MQEFIYYDDLDLNLPLEDNIVRVSRSDFDECLVANSKEIASQCYAPEIDFYLKNSHDDILKKAQNTSILYEARAISFDLAKALDYSQEIGGKIIVVADGLDALTSRLKENQKSVLTLQNHQIISIQGHLGALHVALVQNNREIEVDADWIVWQNAPDFASKQSGVISVKDEDTEEILAKIAEKIGNYKYKNYIFYDSSICQYHERRDEICGKCAEVCPTVAIVKESKDKHLKFSHIDCLGCGGCISVCPSGALDYSLMPVSAFYKVAKLYRDKIPLIMPRKMFDEIIEVDLPKNILPFAIEGEKFLHEAHLLSLLQQSGSQVIFYTDFISKGTNDAISIINQAYKLRYKKEGILVCMSSKELQNTVNDASAIADSYYDVDETHLVKREVFAKRLFFLTQEKSLGVIKSGEHIRYGNVRVNETNCTLCLSCVDACNVGALTADKKDNSLKLNASICTTCDYCEATCPEKDCMEVIRGEIPLEVSWFDKRVLAKDTLFECVHCGKPYATTKSVMKIASMMKPLFLGDEAKIKSLYCCGECKPKVMFETYLSENK